MRHLQIICHRNEEMGLCQNTEQNCYQSLLQSFCGCWSRGVHIWHDCITFFGLSFIVDACNFFLWPWPALVVVLGDATLQRWQNFTQSAAVASEMRGWVSFSYHTAQRLACLFFSPSFVTTPSYCTCGSGSLSNAMIVSAHREKKAFVGSFWHKSRRTARR